jgi:hypothetical protein
MTGEASADPRQTMSLGEYVEYRSGRPLGASGSLSAMLRRSFGAGSFAAFWKYWNPIWGYFLGRYIDAPLRRAVPVSMSVIITFLVSGAIHDAAVWIVKPEIGWLFTPWFGLMGVMAVVTSRLGIRYDGPAWPVRATINLALVAGSLGVVMGIGGRL